MPEHGARERFLMGTSVNTPKLQVPTPEFGHGARARVLDLVLGQYMVLGALEFPVSEHNTIFFSVLSHQCSGTKCEHSLKPQVPCSARAPCPNSGVGTWSIGVFTLVPIKNRSQAPCSGTKSERSLRAILIMEEKQGEKPEIKPCVVFAITRTNHNRKLAFGNYQFSILSEFCKHFVQLLFDRTPTKFSRSPFRDSPSHIFLNACFFSVSKDLFQGFQLISDMANSINIL